MPLPAPRPPKIPESLEDSKYRPERKPPVRSASDMKPLIEDAQAAGRQERRAKMAARMKEHAKWYAEKFPKPSPAEERVAQRVLDEHKTTKAATSSRVREGMQATAKMWEGIKAKSYVANKLSEGAKTAATKAAPVVEAAAKSAPVAKVAAPALRTVTKRLPAVGIAIDAATTGAAVYQGVKASQAHSDLTRTAKSLEKHGFEVETPSFNPLKAAFPAVFGEHPEPKVREKAKAKGKLGS